MADIRTLISSNIRIELLKIFSLNPESSFHINELSRRTGFSPRGVEKELKNLLSGGILKKEVFGNQHRYQLDTQSPISGEIRGIIIKTVGVADRIRAALIPVEDEIDLAFIYGSFAAGDYSNYSDVDLFIVGDLSGIRLAELLGPVQNEIGRPVNISQFSLDEYRQRKELNDHFISKVFQVPRITILGQLDES